MILEATKQLIAKESLSFDGAHDILKLIFKGECEPVQIAAFLTALACKGETAQEVAGMAQAMRNCAVKVTPKNPILLDTCGTGGSGHKTFNISTTAAFVCAGAGIGVAKHGNRAITSKCGSGDILAELGVNIDANPAVIADCIDQANIGFMFAPNHHPAMKYVQPIRKTLGFRTAFNILGPLANPANVDNQIIGVANKALMSVMIDALSLLGLKRAMVVHGSGMDEVTLCGPSDLLMLIDNKVTSRTITPEAFGFQTVAPEALAGGTVKENLALIKDILRGDNTGPLMEVVVLNAACGIYIAGKSNTIEEGLALAKKSIKAGYAIGALENQIMISNQAV
jgi:anthranilate phosphoribosyltransferase